MSCLLFVLLSYRKWYQRIKETLLCVSPKLVGKLVMQLWLCLHIFSDQKLLCKYQILKLKLEKFSAFETVHHPPKKKNWRNFKLLADTKFQITTSKMFSTLQRPCFLTTIISFSEVAIALLNIVFLTYYFLVPESPRWLLATGRTKEAEIVFGNIAKWNGGNNFSQSEFKSVWKTVEEAHVDVSKFCL